MDVAAVVVDTPSFDSPSTLLLRDVAAVVVDTPSFDSPSTLLLPRVVTRFTRLAEVVFTINFKNKKTHVVTV